MRGTRPGRQSGGNRGQLPCFKDEHEITGTVDPLALLIAGHRAGELRPTSAWPATTQTAKPWTRWWWPGSAVDRKNITAQLEAIAAAGIGGVEITPIYGALGSGARYLDFLSPQWVEMLGYTASEARRLGLGVDMATGTGWPFGGPMVSAADGSSPWRCSMASFPESPPR
jgi:hypothetical protein